MGLYRCTSVDGHDRAISAAIPTARIVAVWRDGDGEVWLRDDSGEDWPVMAPSFERLVDDLEDRLRRVR